MSGPIGPIGLFGGSFDPVHNAHLLLAQSALEAFGLETLRWVPSGRPGHREAARARPQDRLEMLRIALANEPRFDIDAAELESQQPTYTVHTLQRTRGEVGPQRALVFLIGADQLMGLDRWREWLRLFDLAHFGVARRPGHAIDEAGMTAALAGQYAARRSTAGKALGSPAGSICLFDMPPLEISSTAVRQAIASGKPPHHWVPAPVLDYITRKGLYVQRKNGS